MKLRIIFLIALSMFLSRNETFAQWSALPQLQYTNIKCFLTAGDSTIFVAGDNATLLRSTNNGSTWTNVMGNGIAADTILSLGRGGGYIFAGAFGVSSVYRSSDNGNSWSAANQGIPALAQVNAFTWIDSTLYLAANVGVFQSTDFGAHWQADTAGLGLKLLYPGQVGGIAGVTSAASKLYAINVSGGVYTSFPDSASWIPIGLDTVWGYAVAAIDTNVFAGTPQGVYLYSGIGTTWLPRSNGLPAYLSYCILTTADTLLFAYIGMRNGDLYATSDLGQHWTKVDGSAFTGKSIHAMATTKQYLVVGTQSGAWRFPLANIAMSVNDDPRFQLPDVYALKQNYPNPFNPATNFQFTISDFEFVTLNVFDELGREVATLVNEHKPVGTYTVRWDAASYTSGIYFYQLRAGRFIETKKMVLLK